MPPGFLAVASQPSSSLSLDEFHAWYEEEHIPLRLNHLPSFLSGARYQAIDSIPGAPGWLAMYEIDDTATFGKESYTSLRAKRSEREKGVMQRLEVLTRITGEDLGVYGQEEDEKNTGMKLNKPSDCVITHSLAVSGAEEHKDKITKEWAEKVAAEATAKIAGWARVRVVKVLESGKTEMGVATELQSAERVEYFIIHEFNDVNEAAIDALHGVIFISVAENISHWRLWKLYKAYPCIAQGNLDAA
ncbi:hypothetical protein BDN70DRAFT_807457 [Pholiota conissans]|uniref:Uncharacterized protein n=1 Tax=Pholiota conissans TaxID=109636 RepID=A0A9P5Z0F1_9AGAR|nr:hypothetical protein BDN70DRAFT_807457 [Pholiota conissans]